MGKMILTESEFEVFLGQKLGQPEYSFGGKKKVPPKVEEEVVMTNSNEVPHTNEMWTDLYQPRTK
jgi:hypothetical protein